MKQTRWLDHLPPWLSILALSSSGLFALEETSVMALPLLLAAVVEWRRWDLSRWQRPLEVGALALALIMGLARIGLLPLLACLIFVLSGIRLALPRALPQRRQILLMGFLMLLMAAMSLPSLDFALWAILWTAAAATCLADQAWPMPGIRPFMHHLWTWVPGALLLAAACFLILPRISAGSRFASWGIRGIGSGAGLAESLDLANRGPVRSQGGITLRLVPRGALTSSQRADAARRLALLKGFSLEALDGSRWEVDPRTPQRRDLQFVSPVGPEVSGKGFELQLAPTITGLIPLPYGALTLRTARLWLLAHKPGGGLGWQVPPRNMVSLDFLLAGDQPDSEVIPPERQALLTQTGEGNDCALRWSRKTAPVDLPAPKLAARLSAELQGYTYTLGNPSGYASNPLEDFLERTRAGHCEYFASALALALRSRRVPARIAVGYRLGPWIPEGGYWLITQNEAHSWVEYYDPEARLWRVADPTPASAVGGTGGLLARLRQIQDVLTFRWDRYVLRYSGGDQLAGLEWMRRQTESWSIGRSRWLRPASVVATLGILVLLSWLLVRRRSKPRNPWSLRELAPLLRRTHKICPPAPGETARAWLNRLALLAPELRGQLLALAEVVDSVAYGPGSRRSLHLPVKEAARNFRLRP